MCDKEIDEYLELYRKVLTEVACFLDGLELDSETYDKIDEILDSIEDKLLSLRSLAEDCYSEAIVHKKGLRG